MASTLVRHPTVVRTSAINNLIKDYILAYNLSLVFVRNTNGLFKLPNLVTPVEKSPIAALERIDSYIYINGL